MITTVRRLVNSWYPWERTRSAEHGARPIQYTTYVVQGSASIQFLYPSVAGNWGLVVYDSTSAVSSLVPAEWTYKNAERNGRDGLINKTNRSLAWWCGPFDFLGHSHSPSLQSETMKLLPFLLSSGALASSRARRSLTTVSNLVSFGDSYTDEGRLSAYAANNGSTPPPATSTSGSNFTSTGGYAWGHFVSQALGAKYYDYAGKMLP